jgi:hypothetical protein
MFSECFAAQSLGFPQDFLHKLIDSGDILVATDYGHFFVLVRVSILDPDSLVQEEPDSFHRNHVIVSHLKTALSLKNRPSGTPHIRLW